MVEISVMKNKLPCVFKRMMVREYSRLTLLRASVAGCQLPQRRCIMAIVLERLKAEMQSQCFC